MVDAPKNSGKAITSLWVVFIGGDPPTFLGLFHDQLNAEKCAAQVEGAQIEHVIVRDKANRETLLPIIA